MRRKASWWVIMWGVLAVLGLAWASSVRSVYAQCGTGSSSCNTCHETQKQAPVLGNAPWHGDQHSAFDCTTCHLGSKTAADQATAHKGLLVKLADQAVSCKTCHAADWQPKMMSYAAILASGGGKSPAPSDPLGGYLGSNPAGPSPTSPSANSTPSTSMDPVRNWILIGAILVISLGGGSYIVQNERKLRSRKSPGNIPTQAGEAGPAFDLPPHLAGLLPNLKELSPQGMEALGVLLEDPSQAEKLFLALAQMDEDTYRRICDQLRRGKPVQTGR